MSPSNSFWTQGMSGIDVANPTATTSVESYRFVIMDLSEGRYDARQRVKTLKKIKVLSEEESINLNNMIDSEDLENLEVVKSILDEKEKIKVGIEAFVDKLKFWKK